MGRGNEQAEAGQAQPGKADSIGTLRSIAIAIGSVFGIVFGIMMLADPDECAGTSMGAGDRCVSQGRNSPDLLLTPTTVTLPAVPSPTLPDELSFEAPDGYAADRETIGPDDPVVMTPTRGRTRTEHIIQTAGIGLLALLFGIGGTVFTARRLLSRF
ncbi:hypothetical protein ABLE92_20075 [Gordonia sp. VNQ95]|uniref:hypothetical protein n=1 Tax=Gordonia TaxID=2053 RepID=UPI0032B5C33E